MEGEHNWTALAVPIFLAATAAELFIARRRRKDLFAFGTALSDLACGSVFQAGELIFKLIFLGAYAWLFEHARFITWDDTSPWPWVIAIVGVDLLFYWWHRVSHVVNVLWAVHGVHHQSEDYNLAVALRQPLFEPITWFFFYAPLALLGVSPVVYLAAYGINRFYQFWIHTQVVDKGPAWVEWLLNTPSHHRVHHGVNPQYLDKNYGAILIVWDRLFGTFEPEVETPVYGTTVPLRSYSPLWANFVHLRRIVTLGTLAKTTRERLWAWVAHPAWLPSGATDPEPKVEREGYQKYRPAVGSKLQVYLLGHFLLAGVAMSVVVFFEHDLSVVQLAAAATVLMATFAAILGLVERKPWAWPLEHGRLLGTAAVTAWLLVAAAGWSVLSAALVAGAFGLAALGTLVVLKPAAEA